MPFWAPYITPLPIIDGGTGASTTAQDLINLGAVPNTVTVAGHPLSSNVTITAADVGADPAGTAAAAIAGISISSVGGVPSTRQVAGHALSSDITLTASDVGADPTGAAAAITLSSLGLGTSSNVQIASLGLGVAPASGTSLSITTPSLVNINNSGGINCLTESLSTTITGTYNGVGITSAIWQTVASLVTNSGTVYSGVFNAYRGKVVSTDDSGTLATMMGLYAAVGHVGADVACSPTTTSVYGLKISPYITRGTINTYYGIYLGAASTLSAPSTWALNTPYTLNTLVKPSVGNGYYFVCTRAGSSGGAEPSWVITSPGSTTAESGSLLWTAITVPSIGTEYGIYVASTTALSYFAGTLQVAGKTQFGTVGIGVAASSAAAIFINGGSLTSGASQYGIDINYTYSANAITAIYGLLIGGATAHNGGDAYTTANMYQAYIGNPTKDADNTITNLYSLYVAQPTVGGTNWAVYVAGGASYFGGTTELLGHVGIGQASTTTSPLSITGLPTANTGLAATDIWNNNGVLNIGTGGAGSGAMVLISSQTLASPASSVTFTAIPGTYTHLRVVWQARGTTAAADITGLNMQCNGDTGADYDRQYIINNPGVTTLSTAYQTAQTSYGVGGLTATTADAGNAAGGTIDIPNYAGTTFHKLFYASSIAIGSLASQRLQNSLIGGQWRNTAAITSLTFSPSDGGTNFVAGSQFVLYGY